MRTAIAEFAAQTRAFLGSRRLSGTAKKELTRDTAGIPQSDPGPERVIQAGIEWLCRAQDNSRSRDGGVAAQYDLKVGWTTSYPETTGYIIPTFLKFAAETGNETLRERARKMLDWLVSIQLDCGAFKGQRVGISPAVPVSFNTGQILLGLAAGVDQLGEQYRGPMRRAADWLVETQDLDGCWRRFPSPFVKPGDKVYDSHIAWGLVEAERQDPGRGYVQGALANARWAASHQNAVGWFRNCCLSDISRPLTHTIGYALRGIIEVCRATGDASLLAASRLTAEKMLGAIGPGGYLAGRLDDAWRPGCESVCLTGSSQIASCYFLMAQMTGDARYADAAKRLNSYVRKTVSLDGPDSVRGGVKGSFPVNGDYAPFEYINWACKFTIDANVHEIENAARQ